MATMHDALALKPEVLKAEVGVPDHRISQTMKTLIHHFSPRERMVLAIVP
jgi:hypothetical protein